MVQPAFYTDRDIALRLNFSPSWVRVQRHLRLKGEPHLLDLNPHHIGRSVRYAADEAEAFIASLLKKAGG